MEIQSAASFYLHIVISFLFVDNFCKILVFGFNSLRGVTFGLLPLCEVGICFVELLQDIYRSLSITILYFSGNNICYFIFLHAYMGAQTPNW